MRRSLLFVPFALLTLALAACGGDDDAKPAANEPTAFPASSDPAPSTVSKGGVHSRQCGARSRCTRPPS